MCVLYLPCRGRGRISDLLELELKVVWVQRIELGSPLTRSLSCCSRIHFLKKIFKKIILILLRALVFCLHVWLLTTCPHGVLGGCWVPWNWSSVVERHHVGSGYWTWVLCRSNSAFNRWAISSAPWCSLASSPPSLLFKEFFSTGFLCVALAALELTLSLPPECWD